MQQAIQSLGFTYYPLPFCLVHWSYIGLDWFIHVFFFFWTGKIYFVMFLLKKEQRHREIFGNRKCLECTKKYVWIVSEFFEIFFNFFFIFWDLRQFLVKCSRSRSTRRYSNWKPRKLQIKMKSLNFSFNFL